MLRKEPHVLTLPGTSCVTSGELLDLCVSARPWAAEGMCGQVRGIRQWTGAQHGAHTLGVLVMCERRQVQNLSSAPELVPCHFTSAHPWSAAGRGRQWQNCRLSQLRRPEVQSQGAGRAPLPAKALGAQPSSSCPASVGASAGGRITRVSVSVITWPFPCVSSVSPSLSLSPPKGTSHGLEATLLQADLTLT